MRAQYGHSSKWYMTTTPVFFAALASASSLRRSPRNGSKNASHGSAANAALATNDRKKSLTAAIVGPDRFRRAADVVLELEQEPRPFFEERRQMLVAARNRAGIVADLVRQLGDGALPFGSHTTIMSTNSFTGVAPSLRASRQRSSIAFCCLGGKRRARLRSNFSTSSGMPSLRRRLWPRGHSTTISASLLPSLNSTVSALAIERLSGS